MKREAKNIKSQVRMYPYRVSKTWIFFENAITPSFMEETFTKDLL